MKLNDVGKLVQNYWVERPNHFSNVMLYEFVGMPDHVHGIIIMEKNVNTGTVLVFYNF